MYVLNVVIEAESNCIALVVPKPIPKPFVLIEYNVVNPVVAVEPLPYCLKPI